MQSAFRPLHPGRNAAAGIRRYCRALATVLSVAGMSHATPKLVRSGKKRAVELFEERTKKVVVSEQVASAMGTKERFHAVKEREGEAIRRAATAIENAVWLRWVRPEGICPEP